MSLSSLYKGKGLILRLAGIMVLLSLLLSFALIPQPAAAGDPSTYPDPDDGNAYGCSVTIYAQVVGTGQFIPPAKVMAGDQIQYTLSLVVPTMTSPHVGFYFQQGELSCTLPDGTYVKVAGFGTDSPAWPLVPTITTVPTAFIVPTLYTVDPTDAVLGKLIAYVDYGSTARYHAQLNGIYHNTPSNPQQTASATASHPTTVLAPAGPGDPPPAGDPPLDPPLAITVGGIAVFPVGGSDSSSPPYAVIIGGAIAALAAIALGGWFAKRRWLRRCS